MRTFALTACLCLTLAGFAVAGPGHDMKTESGWFDMEKCEFCRNLLSDPDLLPHMTWENLETADGMVQVSTVAPEKAAAYTAAMGAMQKLGEDMMSGKRNPMDVKMCGSCAAFGQLTMAGAKMEFVDGEAADVTLITAADPATVAKIHEYCRRNNAEMALLMGGGHDHHAH